MALTVGETMQRKANPNTLSIIVSSRDKDFEKTEPYQFIILSEDREDRVLVAFRAFKQCHNCIYSPAKLSYLFNSARLERVNFS